MTSRRKTDAPTEPRVIDGHIDVEAPPKHLPATAADPDGAEFQSAFDAKRFAKSLDQRSTNRNMLLKWIKDNLKEGIDYGRIHVVKKDSCPQFKQTRQCDNRFHWSKPSLWKPGAEKINGMMGWVPAYPNLSDYTRMVRSGRPISQIILQCVIYNSGRVIGEGIGARALEQDKGDINKALKMAKKSALVDATISSAGLSELFTQDYGDKPEDDDDDLGADPADPYTPGAQRGDDPMQGGGRVNVATHCPIGKHKGEQWSQVPEDYLNWIIATLVDKEDIVEAAVAERRRRADAPQEPAKASEPHARGSSTLREHAAAIVNAKTVDDCTKAWNDSGSFKPALKKSHDVRVAELQQRAADKQ